MVVTGATHTHAFLFGTCRNVTFWSLNFELTWWAGAANWLVGPGRQKADGRVGMTADWPAPVLKDYLPTPASSTS